MCPGALALLVLLSALPPPAEASSSTLNGLESASELALPHPPWQPDPRAQTYPAIAFGGGGYLVVWIGALKTSTAPSVVQAARLDDRGALVDRQVITIGITAASDSYRPAVAWDGARFLVVYRTSARSIVGRFVSPDGQVSQTELVFASAGSSSEDLRWPAVACSGAECLVAWWRYQINTGHSVRLARVSGEALQQADLPACSASSDQHEPAISWNGTHYLVVWRDIRRADGGDIYGARVAPSGEVQDPEGFPISLGAGTEQSPAVVWNGSSWFVVWQDSRSGTDQILGARVTPAAGVEDPDGLALSPSQGAQSAPRVAWNGTDHLVVWLELLGDAYAARISAAGAVMGSPVRLWHNLSTSTQPGVASGGVDFVAAWRGDFNGNDVYAARVSAEGAVVAPGATYLAAIPSAEEQPVVASDGSDYFVVWKDHREGSGRVALYATRVSAEGLPLEPSDLLIAQEDLFESGRAAVAYGAGVYLVVFYLAPYITEHPLMGVRFSRTGERLDSQPFQIGQGTTQGPGGPSLTWNGTDFFVVWPGAEDVQGNSAILGARVTPQGQVRDTTPVRISHAALTTLRPTVAWNGALYLVAWEEILDRFNGVSAISAARVRADGSVQDSRDMSLWGDNFVEPVLAASPQGFLLAAHTDWSVQVLSFGADGTLRGPAQEVARGWHAAPSLAWDGAGYLLAWARTSSPYSEDREIRASRVNAVGGIVDSPPRVLAQTFGASWEWQTEGRIIRPSVVTAGGGRSAVFYPKFAAQPENERMKEVHLFGRLFTGALNGVACTSADSCSSGVCASAGVCCDRPCMGACGTGTCEDLVSSPDAGPVPGGGCGCQSADGGCPPPDAGCEEPTPEPPPDSSRCGCDSAASPFALLALILMGATRARRRVGARGAPTSFEASHTPPPRE